MKGLLRADWLRFRKRGALQVMVIAVPVIAAFFFLAGYRTAVAETFVFDEQQMRQQVTDEILGAGVPPDQAVEMIQQQLDQMQASYEEQRAQQLVIQSGYAFPQSFIVLLGNATFAFLTLILITSTTIGDEFSWGTVRSSLLASSDRRRFLLARVTALVAAAIVIFAALLLLGILLPGLLAVIGSSPPAPPPINPGWLGVLLLADLVISITVIGFATMATLLVRSGGLALVGALIYVAIEGALLALLSRFPAFQDTILFGDPNVGNHAGGGEPAAQAAGGLHWMLDLFPFRATVTVLDRFAVGAGRVEAYPGSNSTLDLGAAWPPLAALAAWGAIFLLIAFWRFRRMDIVE